MCGINGFTFRDPQLIDAMAVLTTHRGPDQTNTWCGDTISLGHNRLAILDLSERASQPMWSKDGDTVIVFNGEVYNFLELRQSLEKKYHFKSNSDTEVVLYAYKEYGADCVNMFNGIFAFAIWDKKTNELFLARDRMGVNPLYYFYDGKRLIFSSEIKAILTHGVPRVVDLAAFNLYFELLYVPEPLTMFEGIKKVPAASYLKWSLKKGVEVKKYWRVSDFTNLSSRSEAVALISELFPRVVKEQLVSDRPVGIFLSGGIDSTAVLGAVSETQKKCIKTYSVGFKDSLDPKKFNADLELAKMTANWYGTDHTELLIGPEDVRKVIDKVVWHLDEPNANPTASAMLLLAGVAKEDVAVVLGGDGGDELFGGYPRYFYSRLISFYQQLPLVLQKAGINLFYFLRHEDISEKISTPAGAQRLLLFLSQKPALLRSIISPTSLQDGGALCYLDERFFSSNIFYCQADCQTDFEKYFMHVDRQTWLVDESLLRTNKMCLGVGLEPRVPILDYRLVELSARLKTDWKFSLVGNSGKNFQGKNIWKESVRKYLPTHIINEKKRGWFTPMAKWLRGELKSMVSDVLLSDRLPEEFFDRTGVAKMWQDHLSGKRYNLNSIWAIFMWVLWYERFIKK